MASQFPLLRQLNRAQQEAVQAGKGHLCINAAAGTGKTSTIAARILYLQQVEEVHPESILAVTFSRAARGHLLARLEQFVRDLGYGSAVQTLTFHGLAYRILRLGIRSGESRIVRRSDFDVIKTARGEINPLFQKHPDYLVGDLRDHFDPQTRCELYGKALDQVRQGHARFEQAVIDPNELPEGVITIPWKPGASVSVDLRNVATVWRRYNKLLAQHNCIDHAGMVSESLVILYQDGEALRRVQEGLRYLIVDEFQDTSRAQEELIRIIAGTSASVNVVGDSDQGIYGFNGADVRNILGFAESMSESETELAVLPAVLLAENYRSSAKILQAANRILQVANPEGSKKLVPSALVPEGPVQLYRERNFDVMRVRADTLDMAASYIAGEIRRLMYEDGVAASEIAVLYRKDTEHARQGAVVRAALEVEGVAAVAHDRDPERTAQVLEVVRNLCLEPDYYSLPLEALLNKVTSHECDGLLKDVPAEEAIALLGMAQRAGATKASHAADVLFEKAAPESAPSDVSGVQVRTIHSAKGLEFRTVFLLYLADREFPSGAHPDVDEERRLYYVGVTRAQERLYVVGRPGIMGPDFFNEIRGDGIVTVNASGQAEDIGDDPATGVDDETAQQIDAARRGLKAHDSRRRTSGARGESVQ